MTLSLKRCQRYAKEAPSSQRYQPNISTSRVKFYNSLLKPIFQSCALKIKLCLIFIKGAGSESQMLLFSRLGLGTIIWLFFHQKCFSFKEQHVPLSQEFIPGITTLVIINVHIFSITNFYSDRIRDSGSSHQHLLRKYWNWSRSLCWIPCFQLISFAFEGFYIATHEICYSDMHNGGFCFNIKIYIS